MCEWHPIATAPTDGSRFIGGYLGPHGLHGVRICVWGGYGSCTHWLKGAPVPVGPTPKEDR